MTTQRQAERTVEFITAYWNGKLVEILDLSDDKQRAYVTSVNDEPIGDKIFVRHVGWCDRTSAYAPVGELVVAQNRKEYK